MLGFITRAQRFAWLISVCFEVNSFDTQIFHSLDHEVSSFPIHRFGGILDDSHIETMFGSIKGCASDTIVKCKAHNDHITDVVISQVLE